MGTETRDDPTSLRTGPTRGSITGENEGPVSATKSLVTAVGQEVGGSSEVEIPAPVVGKGPTEELEVEEAPAAQATLVSH